MTTANEQLISTFYQAFQKKDYKTMQQCYADDAVFNDEVFINLTAPEVKAMWEMFCKRGKDLELQFSNVKADEKNGSAEWTAKYTFSKTGKKVVNHIMANFSFASGKITKHTDKFSFYNWARQALGITGILFGWAPFVKAKVRKEALRSLEKFMDENSPRK